MSDSYNNLKDRLEPLGIYDIDGSNSISVELKCYAAALDSFRDKLDEGLRECLITTSESYGLDNREKVFGSAQSSMETSDRRNRLVERRCFGENDHSPAAFDRFLNNIGVTDFSYVESVSTETLTITISDDLSPAQQEWVKNEIKMFVPAHLDCFIYFGGNTWSVIDGKSLTYAQFESENLAWNALNGIW